MDLQEEITQARTRIRNYLALMLRREKIDKDLAATIAQRTLEMITDGLTYEDLHSVFSFLEKEFPDQQILFHTEKLRCEQMYARLKVKNEVFPELEKGNINEALDKITKLELK